MLPRNNADVKKPCSIFKTKWSTELKTGQQIYVLNMALPDKGKNSKFLILVSSDVTWKPRIIKPTKVMILNQVCVKLRKSYLEKWVTLGKCVRLGKNVSHLKMGHIWKNKSHLEKCVRLRKMWVGHTWQIAIWGSCLQKWSHLGKCVRLRKMWVGHSWQNAIWGSCLEKWVIFGKMGHNWENVPHFNSHITALVASCISRLASR